MKRVAVFLIILVPFLMFAEWIDFSDSSNLQLFEHESFGISFTNVHFSLDGFDLETANESGVEYSKITYDNEGEFFEVGKPSLPQFTRLYAIPNEGEVTFNYSILEEEYLSNITVYPGQELPTESQIITRQFEIDESFYQGVEVFPQKIIEIGEPAIMRDFRIVSVTVNPFQYDPVHQELRVVKKVDISLNTTGSGGANCKTSTGKLSKAFEPLYRSVIQNYEDLITDEIFQQPCYLFIYANETSIPNTLQPLLDWKHQKGFEVHSVSIAETGNTFSTVKNYIQNAYNTWENPPEFICLVGNAGVSNYNVPTDYMDGGEGDQGYVRLDGTDILADAFIGRLSINSETNLQTILYKIFHYEKEPYMNATDWYRKAVLVGDPNGSGPSTIDTKKHVKDMINYSHPNIACTEVYNGGWVSQISTNINNGVAYFNYRGFGGMSGWTTSNIDQLTNGSMLPVCVAITCQTGDFAGSTDCRSERFLKTGSPGSPKGGIAAISTATGMTHTCFNNCIDAGIYYGIFSDGIYNMGGALVRGKLALYQNYPTNPSNHLYQFSYWNNLMGDPGMEIWTDIPADLLVNFADQIDLGAEYMTVQVSDANGIPQQDAWVTALMGDDLIFATGYTDENGEIVLNVNAADLGTANLTVTKHNFKPALETFNVVQSDRFVQIESIVIDDDNIGTSSGNNNNIFNPGETIELQIELHNSGTFTANDVTALLSCNSDDVIITDNEESYGSIPAGSSVFSADDFDIQINPACLGGTELRLDLEISDANGDQWLDFLYFTVEGANLNSSGYTIHNDPNGVLEPGETVELSVTVDNVGFIEVDNVYGILSTENEFIDILDDSGFFGLITAGGQAENIDDQFEIQADTQIIIGTQVVFDLQLFNAAGFDQTLQFIIPIGEVSVTDPVGPDAYGYYIYDDGDVGYIEAPEYDWIEINSIGTELTLFDSGDNGDSEDITLPISFRFYGESYQLLTVCSNGWISPGGSTSLSFMNWEIPGPLGPSPIIAPFWDDLKLTANSGVFWYHDPVNHLVVIEWDQLHNDYNDALETFQVILYDNNFHPTSQSDSQIKFQYQTINNVDQGIYGWSVEHGAYATVGIEDPSSQIGLEYTFNNSYPTAAKVLQNEMALFITGSPIDYQEPYILLHSIVLDDPNQNGLLEYGEDIDFDIILNNIGENPATGVSATISANDQYITITQNTSGYGSISGGSLGTNLTAFHLIVAEDCPNEHYFDIFINVVSNENTWALQLTQPVFAPLLSLHSIFVDDGDNNVLDPNETADLYFSFENEGGAEAYDLLSTISTIDEYITLNSITFQIGNIGAGNIGTAIFNVTASVTAPVGHACMIDWLLEGDFNYTASGSYPVIISQVPVSVLEPFNTFPPAGWSVTSTSGTINWVGSSTNNAGGTAPEAMFTWSPSTTGIQRLQLDPINTIGSSALDLEFKQMISNFSGNYNVRLETTSDGVNWNTVQTWPPANLGPLVENLTISTPDVGSESFQMAFTFDGNSFNINQWYIDEVVLESSSQQMMGFVIGNVTLQGGNGNVEDVVISAGEFTTQPETNGNYSLPVIAGIYDISAFLPGYLQVEFPGMSVNPSQTLELDFDLEFLIMPTNLTASVNTNDITLTWEMDSDLILDRTSRIITKNNSISRDGSEQSKKITENRNRTLAGFNIYRDNSLFVFLEDPATLTYTNTFAPAGDHEYFVRAVYDQIYESLPSNTVQVSIVLATPQNLTAESVQNDIVLNWDAPAASRSLTGYNVYRNGQYIIINYQGTSYTDEDLTSGNYSYYVIGNYGGVLSGASNIVQVQHTEAWEDVISQFTDLQGNYPNPFNPETIIKFSLHTEQFVQLQVFNIKGEMVKNLVCEILPSGYHQVVWDGGDEAGKPVASGLYFYKFNTENYKKINKMLLLK
ncbi:MAG: C25 family cysteine peptidase [Candidatus Cloacimonadales bacterium]|nr:C25 family cysteine peptidase [Candidatus Cloacimonadales bacterium]